MDTTIRVASAFPLRSGEILRIKGADGKTPWRKYTVGALLGSGTTGSEFAATVERDGFRAQAK